MADLTDSQAIRAAQGPHGLWTVAELAAMLEVGEDTVRDLIRRHAVPSVRVSRRRCYFYGGLVEALRRETEALDGTPATPRSSETTTRGGSRRRRAPGSETGDSPRRRSP